jgi:hypothetical protein
VNYGDELGQLEGKLRLRPSGFNKINGRHEETRTPDLYRVKVIELDKSFSSTRCASNFAAMLDCA